MDEPKEAKKVTRVARRQVRKLFRAVGLVEKGATFSKAAARVGWTDRHFRRLLEDRDDLRQRIRRAIERRRLSRRRSGDVVNAQGA